MALGNLVLMALVAAVVPLKPPLSAEARLHLGPTVIPPLCVHSVADQQCLATKRHKGTQGDTRGQIEALKKLARNLADRMEKMTVDDLLKHGEERRVVESVEQSTNRKIEKFSDLEQVMKRAGKPQAEIDRLRNELEQTVEKIHAEGRALRLQLSNQSQISNRKSQIPQ